MNDRQERLVSYVRELHQRDKRGPGDFPIQPAKKTVGSIGDLSFRKIASSMRTSVAGLMQAGSLRSELMIEDNAPPPTAVVAPPQGPHIPSLTQQAAVAYERALLEKPLSAADLIQLESIVLPALRPVFDIQNETYDNLPPIGNRSTTSALQSNTNPRHWTPAIDRPPKLHICGYRLRLRAQRYSNQLARGSNLRSGYCKRSEIELSARYFVRDGNAR